MTCTNITCSLRDICFRSIEDETSGVTKMYIPYREKSGILACDGFIPILGDPNISDYDNYTTRREPRRLRENNADN